MRSGLTVHNINAHSHASVQVIVGLPNNLGIQKFGLRLLSNPPSPPTAITNTQPASTSPSPPPPQTHNQTTTMAQRQTPTLVLHQIPLTPQPQSTHDPTSPISPTQTKRQTSRRLQTTPIPRDTVPPEASTHNHSEAWMFTPGVFHRTSQNFCGKFHINPPDLSCKANGTSNGTHIIFQKVCGKFCTELSCEFFNDSINPPRCSPPGGKASNNKGPVGTSPSSHPAHTEQSEQSAPPPPPHTVQPPVPTDG